MTTTTKQQPKQTAQQERIGLPLIPENIAYINLYAGTYTIVYRGKVEQPTTITMPVYCPETQMGNINISRTQKALSTFSRKEKRTVEVEITKENAIATVKHYQALGIAEKVSDISYDGGGNIIGWTVWFNTKGKGKCTDQN